ncbi:crtK-2 [Scenedesmus sp. PABB004]|nr:crtK-2 [Scenedesmus sp. PABB004]
MATATAAPPAAVPAAPEQQPAQPSRPQPNVERVRQLLYRRLKVSLPSGRVIEGDLACLDKQGNLILSNAVEHINPGGAQQHTSSSSQGGGQGSSGQGGGGGQPCGSPALNQLGMVLVPRAQQADVALQRRASAGLRAKIMDGGTSHALSVSAPACAPPTASSAEQPAAAAPGGAEMPSILESLGRELRNLPRADLGLAASGALVFGVQKLVPTYDASWYKAINKPTWTPPNWVFPAVWIPLKVLQSAALWLVVKQAGGRREAALPVGLFAAHLFLGNAWNVVFFGRREMEASTRWMGAFWATIAASIAAFARVSPLAAALFAPTQVWVTIAAKLNWDIVQLNKGIQMSSLDPKAPAAAKAK